MTQSTRSPSNSPPTPPRGTQRVPAAMPPPPQGSTQRIESPRATGAFPVAGGGKPGTGQTGPVNPPMNPPMNPAQPPHRPAPPLPGGQQRLPQRPGEVVRERRKRGRSGLYLPAWSILLMFGIVFVTAAAIIGLVFLLGGTPAPPSDTVFVIITSEPPAGIQGAAGGTPTATSALLPAQVPAGSYPTFVLEGPTLPPIILSPTPIQVAVGSTVEINSADPVNIRSGAGTDQERLFFANLGERFRVVGGPQQATGLSWWQIVDDADPSRAGWVASNFVDAVAPGQ